MSLNFDQGDLVRRSQSMIGQAVGRGTSLLADRIEHYTNVAREVGDILRERGEPQAADFVTGLGERGTSVARYFRNTEPTELMSDLQGFARERTWLLTGVGFVAGLAIARGVRTSVDAGNDAGDGYRDAYAQPYGSGSYGEESYSQTSQQPYISSGGSSLR